MILVIVYMRSIIYGIWECLKWSMSSSNQVMEKGIKRLIFTISFSLVVDLHIPLMYTVWTVHVSVYGCFCNRAIDPRKQGIYNRVAIGKKNGKEGCVGCHACSVFMQSLHCCACIYAWVRERETKNECYCEGVISK